MRLLLLAALLSTQIIGCAPRTRAGSTVAAIGGAAIAVTGTAMLVDLKSPGNDTNGNGVDDFPENDIACALGGCLIAIGLIAAGLILGGSGLVGLAESAEPQPAPAVPVTAATPPPETAQLDIRLIAPLPEVATDDQTLQMAKQARAAARGGDCDAAWLTVAHIHQRDSRYGNALVASSVLAPCKAR